MFQNKLPLGINQNPLVKSLFQQQNEEGSEPTPPVENDFLLLNGSNFLLLDGTNFLLSGD